MKLALHGLIPYPLKERIIATGSGVWMKDIAFDKGDYIFIQAASGKGKTTLLHMLYGLRSDFSGNVEWGSDGITGMNGDALAMLRSAKVSMVFQDMRLFPTLTAWENLIVKQRLTGTVTESQLAEWMDRLGIANKRDGLAQTLSYGEQQRVSIIRALAQPFEWLLMDEPFSHLDRENTRKAIGLIDEVIKSRSASMLLADLDPNNHFSYTQTLEL